MLQSGAEIVLSSLSCSLTFSFYHLRRAEISLKVFLFSLLCDMNEKEQNKTRGEDYLKTTCVVSQSSFMSLKGAKERERKTIIKQMDLNFGKFRIIIPILFCFFLGS